MKIGVVSDTHSHVIPQQLFDDFEQVDLIIHAGDFCSMNDLKIFKKIAPVRAVFGNMDGLELRQVLPERDIFEVDGKLVGLFHGYGSPDKVLDCVRRDFKKERVDIVIFGHSHYPVNETIDGVLYFNPGSPNDIVRAPYCSYGMIEIRGDKILSKIIRMEP